MYQTTISGDRLYHTVSTGYGEPVELFGAVDNGETPMSLLNIALASCVTMCVQGYFKRFKNIVKMPVEVTASYEEERFSLMILLEEAVNQAEKEAILTYVSEQCRVKKLLRPDVAVTIAFG